MQCPYIVFCSVVEESILLLMNRLLKLLMNKLGGMEVL